MATSTVPSNSNLNQGKPASEQKPTIVERDETAKTDRKDGYTVDDVPTSNDPKGQAEFLAEQAKDPAYVDPREVQEAQNEEARPTKAVVKDDYTNDVQFQKALAEQDGLTLIPATKAEKNAIVEVQGTKTYKHNGTMVVIAKRKTA